MRLFKVITIIMVMFFTFLVLPGRQTKAQEKSADTTAISTLEPIVSEENPVTTDPNKNEAVKDNMLEVANEEVVAEIKVVHNGDEKILLNFKNATLATILEYLSEVAGLVVVMDVEIDGRMTVISRQPMTVQEAISLINSILIEREYAAIRMGRTLKIVPLEEAKKMNIPVRQGGNPEEVVPSDEIVTHVIPIRYAKAESLQAQLSVLLPTYANITANVETNTLVITDTTANIRRMIEIVNAVEPLGRIRECPLGLAAHGVRLCPLHKRLDNALAMVEDAFRQTTLAEILAEPTRSRPLCDFPSHKIALKT